MITDEVKRNVALYLKETVKYANVGNGGNSTSPASTALDVPILSNTTISTVNSESDDTTIDFKATFTGSQLQGNTIREFGLFGIFPTDAYTDDMVDVTVSTYTTNEEMAARVNFEGVGPFVASDQIEFIFQLEVE
tara:strand:+ start:3797 stop:4201 length:405 start_codon:yes stop_codon:yes gene_type:complete